MIFESFKFVYLMVLEINIELNNEINLFQFII